MKTTISKSNFIHDFLKVRPNDFSYEALGKIYDYLVELENESGTEYEFDIVEICGDFTESSVEEAMKDLGAKSLGEIQDDYIVIYSDNDDIIYLNQ